MDLEKRRRIEFLVDELFEGLKVIDEFADSYYTDLDVSSYAYFGILDYLADYRSNAFIEFALETDNMDPEDVEDLIPDYITTFEPFEEGSYKRLISGSGEKLTSMFTENSYYHLKDFLKIFSELDHELLNDNFHEIYEVAFSRLINIQKLHNHVTLPIELNKFIDSVLDLPKNAKVYIPYAGYGTLITSKNKSVKYTIQEGDDLLMEIAELRFGHMGLGISEMREHEINTKDSLELPVFDEILFIAKDTEKNWNPNNEKFDCILVSTKFFDVRSQYYVGGGSLHPYIFCLENGINALKDTGKMMIMVPSDFLLGKTAQKLKKEIIKKDLIETIINFPNGYLSYSETASALMIINKNKKEKKIINFIDASKFMVPLNLDKQILDYENLASVYHSDVRNASVVSVPIKSIENNNYVLDISYHLFNDVQGEMLINLGKVYRGKQTIIVKSKGFLVKTKDLKTNPFDAIIHSTDNINDSIPKGALEINTSCLLLAKAGKSLKPTIFEYTGQSIYIQNNILAFRVNEEEVNLNFLVNELHSDKIINQLNTFRLGATTPYIKNSDLLKIKVEIPSLNEQKIIIEAARKTYSQAKERELELESEILGLKEDVADQNSFLKHKIAGTLKNLRGSFSKLKDIIVNQIAKNNPEIYTFKSNHKLDSNFQDYINRIERDIQSMHKTIKNVGIELNLHELKLETINIEEFVSNYVEEVKNRSKNNFEINFDITPETLKELKKWGCSISADEEYLTQVIDNIIENAVRHAFTEGDKAQNRIKVSILYDFKNFEVLLNFSNTGKPLPNNYDLENFKRRGGKSGKNAGDGFGGWFINEVMKKHEGRLGITNETVQEQPYKDYTTTIELTFPLKIIL